mgnify:CR=1 FL=1
MEFAAFAFFVLYLLPWVAAVAREHERHAAILAANLLVGWTGLGWVAFAVRSDPAPSRARARRNRPALHVVRGEAAVRTSPRAHVALVPTHR